MDDEMPPRLPPRYSSLPRRSNGKAMQNQWTYEQSEPGPSTFNAPQPFTRDYQHQSSSRSFANQPHQNNKQPAEPARRMGNGQSAQVREAGDVQPMDWLHAPPTQPQPQNGRHAEQQGPGRPPSSASRRPELDFASEHSVLPEGPRVAGRETKKKKSLRKRFGSFLSYTIRTFVAAVNGTSAAERRARAEQSNSHPPPKRTQSLTRIDMRSEDVPHRRTQSVRVPKRVEEPPPPPLMDDVLPRQPFRATRTEQQIQSVIPNGSRGLFNIGNTCYLAAAVQALRPVVTDVLKALRIVSTENTEDLVAIRTLFEKMDNGSYEEMQNAFEIFVNLFCRLRSVNRGDQDDASLCLVDILSRLHDRTKRVLPSPNLEKLFGRSPHEQFFLKNQAEENSPFYELVTSILQTKSICFKCERSSLTFHNDTLIPCVIPPEIRKIEEDFPPLRASYVRSVAGRCQNVRTHLNRFACNLDPNICELKNQMYDHELIHPFDLTRTELFTHGRDGWDRIGANDNTIVKGRYNEYLTAVEFPYSGNDRLVILMAYGGEIRDGGPLFFSMKMRSTVGELREQLREYLRASHPFPCEVFLRRELLPDQKSEFSDDVQLMGGPFEDFELVQYNVAVLKSLYPHLPSFLRVTCKFDVSAIGHDTVSVHRSAAKPKYARKHKFRIDSYMHAARVDWRCPENHADKSGQIISFCYPAEFIFIQIRRVDHNYNGNAYKVRDQVHVPTLIDLAPIYRQDWPESGYFKTPRIHRPRMMYELVSVISHEGGSYNSGHYTSYVYNPDTKTFTKYSDDMVREAPQEAIHIDPFVVIYRRKPNASFAETKYGIVQFAPDAEEIHRVPERRSDDGDDAAMQTLQRSRSHVKFDKSKEPRYHPDRPPADLKGSKRNKKPKK